MSAADAKRGDRDNSFTPRPRPTAPGSRSLSSRTLSHLQAERDPRRLRDCERKGGPVAKGPALSPLVRRRTSARSSQKEEICKAELRLLAAGPKNQLPRMPTW
jgi:hypothetical protein